MIKKVYYKVCFTPKSPLRIGNSDSERTDSDLMLDGRGLPFIPGTSIAGVLRSMLSDSDAVRVFGNIKDGIGTDSHIVIGDAVLSSMDKVEKYKRDGVALDDWGMVGNKFDFEVAETDGKYNSILEWEGSDSEYDYEIKEVIDPLLTGIIHNGISFGARTTRGYGFMSVSIQKRVFEMPGDIEQWLSFSAYSENAFDESEYMKGSDTEKKQEVNIVADIVIDGNFSVSNPTSSREPIENGASPDKVPLKNYRGLPVISGSSWAGTFRHHMNSLCKGLNISRDNVSSMFGIDDEKTNLYSRSMLKFEETEIFGGKEVVITRNAVDRFTSAPKNTGLFTAQVCYGGEGKLRISFRKDALTELQKQLLSATLFDINMGFVTAGGEAGVGRGRIKIKKLVVNDDDRTSLLYVSDEKNMTLDVGKMLEV